MTAAKNMIAIREKMIMDRSRTDPDQPSFLYFFAASQIKNKPANRSNAPVIKEIGPDRSNFHVPQIACDDTNNGKSLLLSMVKKQTGFTYTIVGKMKKASII